jgi:uncharacterized RDD family membrane protein YckC
MIDGLFAVVANMPGYLGTTAAATAQTGVTFKNPFFIFTNAGKWGVVAAVLTVALLAVQWSLIATRGQSIGKIVVKTRIVMLDGSRAGFASVIVWRTFLVWLFGHLARVVPVVGILITVDVLMVFAKDRRCLHDRIAGTKVVAVRE